MFEWFKTFVVRPPSYPPAPEGTVLYALGDIHGRSDCLAHAHTVIDRDVAKRGVGDRAVEVYVGDYVDRGPDAKGVIDRLISRSASANTIMLRGNHEIIMESFLRGLTSFEDWRTVGGLETVLSYGVDVRSLLASGRSVRPRDLAERLPSSHIQFLSGLRYIYQAGRYCFVHAGIRPSVPIDKQSAADMSWIRDDFLQFTGDFGFIIVHGHTPVSAPEFLPNRMNIDTGAYATNRLSVIRIDAEGVSILENARA